MKFLIVPMGFKKKTKKLLGIAHNKALYDTGFI
jgi:hypothetical protein